MCRPLNLLLTGFLFGVIYLAFYPSGEQFYSNIGSDNFIYLLAFVLLTLAGGYLINDFFDLEEDRYNRPVKIKWRLMLGEGNLLLSYIFILIFALTGAIGFTLNSDNYLLLPIWLASSAALLLYAKHWKRSALAGNLLVAFLCSMLPFLFLILDYNYLRQVKFYGDSAFKILLVYTFFAFMLTLIREIVKDFQDLKGDHKAGIRTLAGRISVSKLKVLLLLLSLVYLSGLLLAALHVSTFYSSIHTLAVLLLIPSSLMFIFYIIRLDKGGAASRTSLFLKLTFGIGISFLIIL